MARHSLWPKGLTGRVILVLVLAVLFQFLAGSVLIRTGEMHIQRQDLGRRVAEQVLIAERIITAADRSDRSRLLESLSTIHSKNHQKITDGKNSRINHSKYPPLLGIRSI